MVTEKTIEKQIAVINDAKEKNYTAFSQEQPVVLSYLMSESFEVLTDEERNYLLFLGLVIWKSCKETYHQLPVSNPKEIEQLEEENWTLLNEQKGDFHKKLNVFFDQSEEEDLLALIEDALVISDDETETDEDDFQVTKEGREAVFVTLKTLVDIWT